jgi:hypothetical protein
LVNLDGELYFAGLIDDSMMNGDLVSFMIDWLIETQKKSLQMAVTREFLFELKKDVLKSIQK